MAWTHWRKIADRNYWYDEELDYDGPACYELAIAGPFGGNGKTVYVGETRNEKRRMIAYASYGSHLGEIIDWHLNREWCLHYHALLRESKIDAIRTQNALLRRFVYDWNILLNHS